MAIHKEVEHVTRTRMVNRHDIAEYEAEGWKFVRNTGQTSAIMSRMEKVKAVVVPSIKEEPKKKEEKED